MDHFGTENYGASAMGQRGPASPAGFLLRRRFDREMQNPFKRSIAIKFK